MTPCEHKTPFVGCAWCYRLAPDPKDVEIKRLRDRLREILRGAVLCEHADDLVLGLVAEAKSLGITKDGHTLEGGDDD